jgi:hypothetical protein
MEYTKQDSNYRRATERGVTCGNCKYFIDDPETTNDSCELVDGSISANYTCDLWEKKELAGVSKRLDRGLTDVHFEGVQINDLEVPDFVIDDV